MNAYVLSSLKMYSLSHKHKLSTFSSYSAILDCMFVSICNIFQYSFWRRITAFKAGLSFLIEIYIFPFCRHPLNSCFTEVLHSHECSNLASVEAGGGESSVMWILTGLFPLKTSSRGIALQS